MRKEIGRQNGTDPLSCIRGDASSKDTRRTRRPSRSEAKDMHRDPDRRQDAASSGGRDDGSGSEVLRRKIALFREYAREIEAARTDRSLSWDERYELITMLKKERAALLDHDEAA